MKKYIIGFLLGIIVGVLLAIWVGNFYNSSKSDAAHAYALSLIDENKIDSAIGVLHEAIGINRDNPKPYATLGTLYEKSEKYRLSYDYYNYALKLVENGYKTPNLDRGFLLEKVKKIEKKLQ